jgi:hypothetical protein
MNWTGQVLATSRSNLGELMSRKEAERTGVYLLLGDEQAYIGEADVIKERLRMHNRPESSGGKDFWTEVVILTSKDSNLTKAHARYLESRLISIARRAGRLELTNGTSPDPIALPEADVSDMEYYISQAQILLPVLGVSLLREQLVSGPVTADSRAGQLSPVFVMHVPGGGQARAQEIDGEFTVLADSQARLKWVGGILKRPSHNRRDLRQKLIDEGLLQVDGEWRRFIRNFVFTSPSTAAAVIVGTETHNGRSAWRVEGQEQTYGEWQTQVIEAEERLGAVLGRTP